MNSLNNKEIGTIWAGFYKSLQDFDAKKTKSIFLFLTHLPVKHENRIRYKTWL